MNNLIKKTIALNKTSLLVYTIIAFIFIWMYIAMFPKISDQADEMMKIMASFPEGMMQAFNFDNSVAFSTLEGFLATEYFSLLCPLLMIIFAINYGSSAIAGEIDNKTIQILGALPISRINIYKAKYIAGTLMIIALVMVTILPIIPLTMVYTIDLEVKRYLFMAFMGFLFAQAIFSIAFLLSSTLSSRGKAATIASGIMILMYAANLFALLNNNLNFLKYGSLFYYLNVSKTLISQEIDIVAIIVMLSISVLTFSAGMVHFNRRDLD